MAYFVFLLPFPSYSEYWDWNANRVIMGGDGNSIVGDNTTEITGINKFVTRDPWVDVRSYGVSTSNTGAANLTAFQAAFDNASTGSIKTVLIPAGNYNLTGTVITKGCPIIGDGSDKTVIFPTTSAPAFRVTAFTHGKISGIGVNYTNVTAAGITAEAVGFDLYSANQCIFEDLMVTRGYDAFRVTIGSGDGYIWQTKFTNCISNYNKNLGWNINSASDSTTIKFENCHVYGVAALDNAWSGGWTTYSGWRMDNVTTVVMSNCSMDGGDGSADGSVIYYNNGQHLFIDTFHLESHTRTAGGTSNSPIFIGSNTANIGTLFLVSYTLNVGGGNTGYVYRTSSISNFTLGNIKELGPITTSGTRGTGNNSGVTSGIILGKALARSTFNDSGNPLNVIYMNEYFNNLRAVQKYGSVLADNTAQVLISWPVVATYYGPSGIIYVNGFVGGGASSFSDVVVVTATTEPVNLAVVGSDNVGSPPTRTYTWASDNVSIQLGGASSYYTHAHGTATYY